LREVALETRSLAQLEGLVRPSHLEKFRSVLGTVANRLEGRTLWHVNSTSEGGGVAELLHQLLEYLIEGGIRCRWIVVEGDQDFFWVAKRLFNRWVTKRLHNRLHGSEGDGGPLGEEEREMYMGVLRRELAPLLDLVSPGDIAILHDPQTAGLAGPLVDTGLAWSGFVTWALTPRPTSFAPRGTSCAPTSNGRTPRCSRGARTSGGGSTGGKLP